MQSVVRVSDNNQRRPGHSDRLKALLQEAAKVREAHAAGDISADEAAKRLDELKRRHDSFLSRIIDL